LPRVAAPRRVAWLALVAAALALPACAAPREGGDSGAESPSPLAPAPLGEVVRIYDAASGERLDLAKLLDRLASREAVFVGETHLDETTHRLELAILEGLIRRKEGRVVLALEMFERDVQPEIDAYLAGEIDETEFLAGSRPWSNYRTGYRPLLETARREGIPVLASNPPSDVRRKLAFAGPEGLESLSPEERALLPEKLLPNSDAYWERFARVVRGHMGAVFLQSPDRRLTSSQSLWDNAMGENVVRGLERYPGSLVVHVNGGFHSSHHDGAVAQLLQRRPATRVSVVDVVPVDDTEGIPAPENADEADYVAYVESRAQGVSEGFHAVTVFPDLRYRLHLPEHASDAHPVPLLIWLPNDGFRAEDGLALWKTAIGKEAALAIVETPYPQLEPDLHIGGRWYWKDTFSDDLGTVETGIAEIGAYVLRHFPIRRDAVALGGEGTGATVVSASALYGGTLSVPVFALAPRRFAGLRELALPEKSPDTSSETGLPGKHLTVFVGSDDEEWWTEEIEDYSGVGLDGEVRALPEGESARFEAIESAVREALHLPAPTKPSGEGVVLVLGHDTPLARAWALLLARKHQASGKQAVVAATAEEARAFLASGPAGSWAVRPLAFAGEGIDLGELPEGVEVRDPFGASDMGSGMALPIAPGAFGGTTVLILPAGVAEEEVQAWTELADSGIIRHRSRFASLRVVREEEENGLVAVLEELRSQGRTSVVVVPAVFCATPEAMWEWRAAAERFRDTLDLTWSPGLGGRLYLLDAE